MGSHGFGKTEFPGKACLAGNSFHKAAQGGNIGHLSSIAETWGTGIRRQRQCNISKKPGRFYGKKACYLTAQGIGGARSVLCAARRKEWSGPLRRARGTPQSPVSGTKRRKCAQIFLKNLRNVKLPGGKTRALDFRSIPEYSEL
jgi:hypothetical protein